MCFQFVLSGWKPSHFARSASFHLIERMEKLIHNRLASRPCPWRFSDASAILTSIHGPYSSGTGSADSADSRSRRVAESTAGNSPVADASAVRWVRVEMIGGNARRISSRP